MQKKKGITLTVLVLTIIVLLILAGVSITVILGDKGAIKKAEGVAEGTKEEVNDKKQELNELTQKVEGILSEETQEPTPPPNIVKKTIKFWVNDIEYEVEEGTTWYEFYQQIEGLKCEGEEFEVKYYGAWNLFLIRRCCVWKR